MTREDLANLKKSLKDPRFKELLKDYMMEISDPGNKAEADAYLRQLETEGELPKGMKLIQPVSFMCMASKIASEEDKKYTQTIYINICTHEEVQRAHPGEADQGRSAWQVPYFLGKQRYDQDGFEDKEIVCVLDIVFNSNVVVLCEKMRGFQKMLCDIAFDAVSKVLGAKRERLDPDYALVKQAKCKGSEPALMPVKDLSYTGAKDALRGEDKPKLYHEINKMKEDAQTKTKEGAGKMGGEEGDGTEENAGPTDDGTTPKYTISYVYTTDSDDFIESDFKKAKRISALKLNVKLPRLEEFRQLNCDFDGDTFTLSYGDVYYLNLRLPVKVLRDNYRAKFDKSKRELNLEFQPAKPVPIPVETVRNDPPEDIQTQENPENVPQTDEKVTQVPAAVPMDSEIQVISPENATLAMPASDVSEEKPDSRPQVVFPFEQKQETAEPEATKHIPPRIEEVAETPVEKEAEGEVVCVLPIFNLQTVGKKTFLQLRVDHAGEGNVEVYHRGCQVVVYPNQTTYFSAEIDGFAPENLQIKLMEGFVALVVTHGGTPPHINPTSVTNHREVRTNYLRFQPSPPMPKPTSSLTEPSEPATDKSKTPQDKENADCNHSAATTTPNKAQTEAPKPKANFNCLRLAIQSDAFTLI